jgi:uncharacterized membrane protein
LFHCSSYKSLRTILVFLRAANISSFVFIIYISIFLLMIDSYFYVYALSNFRSFSSSFDSKVINLSLFFFSVTMNDCYLFLFVWFISLIILYRSSPVIVFLCKLLSNLSNKSNPPAPEFWISSFSYLTESNEVLSLDISFSKFLFISAVYFEI